MATSPSDWDARGRRFSIDAVRYLPAAILPAIFSLVGASIFTRLFPPSEYGVFSLIVAFTGPVTMVLTEWVAQPVGRFFAEYERRRRVSEFLDVIVALRFIVAASIVLSGLLVLACYRAFSGGFPNTLLFLGALAAVFFQSFASIAMPVLNARMQIGAYRLALVATTGLAVAIPLGLIYLLGRDIAWLLWGQAAASALLLPWLNWQTGIRRFVPRWRGSARFAHTVRRMWRYGAPMVLWFFAVGLMSAEDRYIIAAFRGPAEVGIYGVNYGLVAGLGVLLNLPVNLAIGPLLYQAWAHRRWKDVETALEQMTEMYVIIGVAIIGGTIVVGQSTVNLLLGTGYREGAVILVPVIVARMLWGVSRIGHKVLELRERPFQMVRAALAVSAINICLDLALVPFFGYVAAAYTTAFSFLVHVAITWVQARGSLHWELRLGRFAQYLAMMGLAVGIVHLGLGLLHTASALVVVFAGGTLYCLVYGGMLYTLFGQRLRHLVGP